MTRPHREDPRPEASTKRKATPREPAERKAPVATASATASCGSGSERCDAMPELIVELI